MLGLPAWLSAAASRQDYLWFLVAVGWLQLALFSLPPTRTYLRAIAGSTILLAIGEVGGMLLVHDASGIPARGTELVLAVLAIAPSWTLLTVLLAQSQPASRALLVGLGGVGLAAGLGWFRSSAPLAISLIIAGVGTLPLIFIRRHRTTPAWAKDQVWACFVIALVIGPWLASTGPLAEWAGHPRRWLGVSPWGLLSALWHLFTLLLAGRLWLRGERSLAQEFSRENLRSVARLLAMWFILGAGLVEVAGSMAYQGFVQSWEDRLRTCLGTFDEDALAASLGAEFELHDIQAHRNRAWETWSADAPAKATPTMQTHQARLNQLSRSNPDFDYLLITTLKAGWIAIAYYPTLAPSPRPPTYVPLDHRATEGDRANWENARAFVRGPLWSPFGTFLTIGHPIISSQGGMAGWLTFMVDSHRLLAAVLPARLLMSVTVMFGALIGVSLFISRARGQAGVKARHDAAAAQAADRMKSDLLARVSHELRTPLQGILGYAELIGRESLSADQAMWLESQRRQSALMQRLVNDLIDLSALENQVFRLATRPGQLAALTSEVVASLRPRAQVRRLKLEVEVDPGVPEWLEFDADRIRQILLNLVGNAIKYTLEGRVHVRLALLQQTNDQAEVELAVADTGPGIPLEAQTRLFEEFTRFSDARVDTEGLGLGLALSRGLVQVMGGTLEIESDGQHGSTFRARLPLAVAAAPRPNVESPVNSEVHRGQHIVVADDNSLVRELYLAHFRASGAEALGAPDGQAALDLVAQNPSIDVLVIDLAMPKMDGAEVTQKLRAAGRTALRIVGASAHADAADRDRALQAGMDAFLVKPVQLRDLSEAVAHRRLPPIGESIRSPAPAELAPQLYQRFLMEAPIELATLEKAFAGKDWTTLSARAHYLKNSAWVVGHERLQNSCGELYRAATPETATAAAKALETIRDLLTSEP